MNYRKDYRVLIQGDFACFTRPEFAGERVSYSMITPSAARNILQAVYWQKGFDYVIDRIHVLNEIKTLNWRTNEVGVKVSSDMLFKAYNGTIPPPHIYARKETVQRNSQILVDVAYVVDFHIRLWKSHQLREDKVHGILMDRLKKRKFWSMPHLGLREFPCNVTLWPSDKEPESYYSGYEQNFGRMFLDRNYKTGENTFFDAHMIDGTIEVPNYAY